MLLTFLRQIEEKWLKFQGLGFATVGKGSIYDLVMGCKDSLMKDNQLILTFLVWQKNKYSHKDHLKLMVVFKYLVLIAKSHTKLLAFNFLSVPATHH